MFNLDTHILLMALRSQLRPKENALLARSWRSVSAIVFWEIAKLRQLVRIEFNFKGPALSAALKWIEVWPIDPAIAIASTRLDSASDPADELIAATGVVHRIPLLTRDRAIRRSKIVPLAT